MSVFPRQAADSVSAIVGAENYRKRIENVGFDKVRREVFGSEAEECEECGTRFWKAKCPKGCQPYVRHMCRKDNICAADSFRRSSELAGDFVRVAQTLSFSSGVKLRFYRWEFTMPRDIQKGMTLDEGYEFTKEVKSYAERYLRNALNIPDEVQLGSAVVFQMLHSSDPFGMMKNHNGVDRRHFHYHGVTLAWGVWKGEASVYRFPKNLFIDDSEVVDGEKRRFVKLRAGWRAVLEGRFGKSNAKDVDCYIRYESGPSELYHRFRYMMRGNVEDFAKWTLRYGYPQDYDKEWVREALTWKKGSPRVLYYGFLSPKNLSQSNKFMRKIALVIPVKAQRLREARKLYCDKHGEELHIDFAAGLKHISDVMAGGGTIVVRLRRGIEFEAASWLEPRKGPGETG
jgi:hypothetical protein